MAATTGGGASPGGGTGSGGGAALEEECEVVRVRVKKNEGQQPPEFRSFAVDPQITSLDVLQHILARAFDLQGKKSFVLSFAARDGQGQDTFVPLLSDGDLANAFTCARPTLRLRLDVRNPPDSPLLEDWDIISPREVAAAEPVPERRSLLAAALPFTQALLAQVGRTLARAQAALAWPEGTPAVSPPPPPPPPCAPLSDADLRSYLGPGGRLLRPQELRLHVFHGGVEPGLRKVVWRYLLNIFPAGLTGQERLSHLRLKSWEYASLKSALAARAGPAQLAQVTAAVRKDVVRTDRAHPYFGGPEEGHPHLAALQDLLTTFALGHPRLSYCQGMSDVAAPLLAVLDDEAQAYLCFCSLMRRLAPRFRPGGRGLARAFAHLRRLLRRADPAFWAFLAARGAHDLLFCYRWLLLELKREFAFEEALKVLEITWSSLPPAPAPPPRGVPLLGAPLGAGKGWRERRGMRPRRPKRRRRRRKGKEEEEEGGGGGGGGGEAEEARSCGEVPEGPRSSGEVQDGPKSFTEVPDGPRDSQEGPRSFSESPGGPRDIPDDPRSSTEVPESPRSFTEVPDGPRDIPDDPKSSSEVLDVPKSSTEVPDGSKSSGGSPGGLKASSRGPEGLKSSGDVPDGPKSSNDAFESPGSFDHVLEGSEGTQEGPKSSRDVPNGPKSFRKVQGRPPKDVGEAPEVSKDSEPGGPRKVEEGTDALEMEQRAQSFCWGAGGDPGEGQEDVREGHNPREARDDPKNGRDDPKNGRDGPKTGQDDPKKGLSDPRGGGDDPGMDRGHPRKVHDDLGEGHGLGGGHHDLRGDHHDPRDGHDTSRDGQHDPKEGHDDPKDDHHDPKGGHHDLNDSHHDPRGDHHDPKDDHHDPKGGHHDARDGLDTSRDGHSNPRSDHHVPKDGHYDPNNDHLDLKGDHDLKDDHNTSSDDHHAPKDDHDPNDDHHDPKPNPTTPDDPWGGRWAWEDPSSSSCSSSCSSCSSSSSSDEEDLAVEDDGAPLPPPEELGQGNPFVLFVCLAMLLEQREAVMARAGDYNEVAMHFDRLVRRHHLPRVLRRAKALFARYLEGWGGAAAQVGPPSG